jgi:hypothetical protein
MPIIPPVDSSTEPSDNELNNDPQNDPNVAAAIASAGESAGGKAVVEMVSQNQAAMQQAVAQLGQAAQVETIVENNVQAAGGIIDGQYQSISAAVIHPQYDTPILKNVDGNYHTLILMPEHTGNATAPVPVPVSAANQYDAVNSPFRDGDLIVEPVLNATNRSAVNRAANPDYSTFLQSRCVKVTAGLVGAASVVGGVLAVLFTQVFNAGAKQQAQTPPDSPVPPTEPPAVPQSLMATPQDQTSILLAWAAVTGADYYVVKRNGVALSTNPTLNSVTDSGLTAGTSYSYTVSAHNASGASADSAPVVAKTLAVPPPAPEAPTGLIGLAMATDKIRISWLSAAGATAYEVKRRLVTDTAFVTIATVPNPGTLRLVYEDTGLQEATEYCYTVAASNANGSSPDTPWLCFNTQNALDVQAAKIVTDFNSLSEAVYWNQLIAWISTDQPSFDVQLNVAAYTYGIVDKSKAATLVGEAAIEQQVTSLLNAYQASNRDTLSIYRTLATLTAGRGVPVERYEKINLLVRVLGNIISPNKKKKK